MQSHCIDAVILHSVVDGVKSDSGRAPGLRAARVARTEDDLIAAARALFLEQGYVATTLAQVAQRAGVAARTVYVRFGTKATLFTHVVDRALLGDAEPIDVAFRSRAQESLTGATLGERIDALADLCVGIAERAGPLFEVATQAEGIEPVVAEAAQNGRRGSAARARSFWRHAADDGLVRAGADVERLAVTTDLLICADTVVHLRRAHGWSTPAYRSLIIETLTALTQAPEPLA